MFAGYGQVEISTFICYLVFNEILSKCGNDQTYEDFLCMLLI